MKRKVSKIVSKSMADLDFIIRKLSVNVSDNTKLPFQGVLFGRQFGDGEPKASLTEYLEKNKEKLVLLRFSFDSLAVAG